jgi:threonine synthase
MITKAYSSFQHKDVAPIRKLDKGIYIHELFHGPTGSFKDLALQLMPKIFDESAKRQEHGQVFLKYFSGFFDKMASKQCFPVCPVLANMAR